MKTKHALTLIAILLPLAARAEIGAWQKDYDALLKKYVSGGGVRYSAWKGSAADMATLDKVVAAIGSENPSGLSRNDKLAFYINAYNAWIIHLVLEKYPIKSVRDYAPLFGIFTCPAQYTQCVATATNGIPAQVAAAISDARDCRTQAVTCRANATTAAASAASVTGQPHGPPTNILNPDWREFICGMSQPKADSSLRRSPCDS
jgi:hypothetical protein